jgi:hypothetical protein
MINNITFNGDEFWSLNGLMVHDQWQIHMKWVTNYNNDSIEHLAFLLHGEKIWAHWGAICSKISVMLPMK